VWRPSESATTIHIERPKQASHGDFACNLAMQLARSLKRNPRQLAQLLLSELPYSRSWSQGRSRRRRFHQFPSVAAAKLEVVREVLEQGSAFGRSTAGGKRKVLVEFVSANPTGPLHVGHGRGAAYGDSLCKLLAFAGWDGDQRVLRQRRRPPDGHPGRVDLAALPGTVRPPGEAVAFPPNAYQGDYVRDMARQMLTAHGDRYLRPLAAISPARPGLPEPSAPTPKPNNSAKPISTR
jgi:arginyl-tRNA synthetase